MNRKKMPVFVLMIALVLIFATGCGKDEAVESWAYNFDETSKVHFKPFAEPTSTRPQKYVLGCLLADG